MLPVCITRLTLRNYRSIAECSLALGSLTFLVGPNGSGKSSCLDSLRFVAESLRTSLDHAFRSRISAAFVCHDYGVPDEFFAIRLDFNLSSQATGYYGFQIGMKKEHGFEVQIEECWLDRSVQGLADCFYRVELGQVTKSTMPAPPPATDDRLYLVTAAGLPEFRTVYDVLSGLEVYNLSPTKVGDAQRFDGGEVLRSDGSNAASVLQNLSSESKAKVNSYLSRIVVGIDRVEASPAGQMTGTTFFTNNKKWENSTPLLGPSMSDGTLRSLGILLALFQSENDSPKTPSLIGLEEPETGLHPAAAVILLAALREASNAIQIVVTSHSPDLLDDDDIPIEAILAVENVGGETKIAVIDEASRTVLRQKLFTPGELLRQNQLTPDPAAFPGLGGDRPVTIFELDGE